MLLCWDRDVTHVRLVNKGIIDKENEKKMFPKKRRKGNHDYKKSLEIKKPKEEQK